MKVTSINDIDIFEDELLPSVFRVNPGLKPSFKVCYSTIDSKFL